MHVRHRWVVCVLAPAACATYAGNGEGEAPYTPPPSVHDASVGDAAPATPDASGSTSSSGGVLSDAATDAGGDPSLLRAPKVGCQTPVDAAILAQTFPGYTRDVFVGEAHNVIAESYLCDDVLSLGLRYDPPQPAGSVPGLMLARTQQIVGSFTMSWVVEAVTKPNEDEETSLGPLLLSRSGLGSDVLAVMLRHRTATGEVVLRHGILRDGATYEPVSIGTPTPPYRVQWSVEHGDATHFTSTIRVTDGTRAQITSVVTDALNPDSVELSFGMNRAIPGSTSRVTFSELTLP